MINGLTRRISAAAILCVSVLFTVNADAFALLGPFQPWMEETNGLRQPGDIGGPMDISNEYRWNVPVITYGFDQSFLNYFGTNGVHAVENAIQILNDLPAASTTVLTNYQFNTANVNYTAQAQGLSDLKSETLSLMLEHLGLAQPTRYIYVINQWDSLLISAYGNNLYNWPEWTSPDFIVKRNFDPETFDANSTINNILYSGSIGSNGGQNYIVPFTVNPLAAGYPAVADYFSQTEAGMFFNGLTYDDVGGLRYLYSTNNINYETLLPGVIGVGTNANSYVNGAWRPGIDKITFVEEPIDPITGELFLQVTNYYTDTYITNGVLMQQQLARVISKPDFLFSAGNESFRTGTTNWINNAALNNNPDGAGPGIIPPPVVITFQKTGNYFYNWISYDNPEVISEDAVQDLTAEIGTLGSFDGSSNAPVIYPAAQTGNVSMMVQVLLRHANTAPIFQNFELPLTGQAGTIYTFQTSTNLLIWNTLFEVTNNGSICTYQNINANSSSRFYRIVSQ